jgi:glutamate synthase (NADPH/NADH)
VQGATFDQLAMDAFKVQRGWPSREMILSPGMPESSEYHWRDGGEVPIKVLPISKMP